MTNLLFKSSLRASTLSAWSLFSPRDFSRVLARLSESGLALSPSGGREEKTLSCLSSEHMEMSESAESKNERPEAKVLKESSRLQMTFLKTEVSAKVVNKRRKNLRFDAHLDLLVQNLRWCGKTSSESSKVQRKQEQFLKLE